MVSISPRWLASAAVVLIVATASFYGVQEAGLPDHEEEHFIERHTTLRDAFSSLHSPLSTAESSYDVAERRYVAGRTLLPRFSMDVHPLTALQRYIQLKEFVWIGMATADFHLGVAVLQFHYASVLVVQLFQRPSSSSPVAKSLKGQRRIVLLPPELGVGGEWIPDRFPNGSYGPHVEGHQILFRGLSAPWDTPLNDSIITFTAGQVCLNISAAVRGGDGSEYVLQLVGAAAIPEKRMGLVYPLGPHRAAVVQKVAGAPFTKSLELRLTSTRGDARETVVLSDGYMAMDYTRGLLRRTTAWHWACVTEPTTGIGLHLSSGTYDIDDISMESSIHDHRQNHVEFLNQRVLFNPPTSNQKSWVVESPSVRLRFVPHDGHDGRVKAGLVNVELNHMWGLYDGEVEWRGTIIHFKGVPGVLEEHYGTW